MSNSKENKKLEAFFPYYVNQGRLLDIYAILNGGYSEYAEITTTISEEKSKSGKVEASASGGFKIFSLGGNMAMNAEKEDAIGRENKEKKVQTVTSMLSIVLDKLTAKGYFRDILTSKPGDFIHIPVILSINSIKSLIEEMTELIKLAGSMKNLGAEVKGIGKENKQITDILKTIQVLFGGEEILCEEQEYAIIGNIVDANLYQAARSDIIGTELTCVAQVKRVYSNGTELMKNTIFTKIKDTSAKEKLIEAIATISDSEFFDFEAVAVPSIQNKPVYQLEIIALYQ